MTFIYVTVPHQLHGTGYPPHSSPITHPLRRPPPPSPPRSPLALCRGGCERHMTFSAGFHGAGAGHGEGGVRAFYVGDAHRQGFAEQGRTAGRPEDETAVKGSWRGHRVLCACCRGQTKQGLTARHCERGMPEGTERGASRPVGPSLGPKGYGGYLYPWAPRVRPRQHPLANFSEPVHQPSRDREQSCPTSSRTNLGRAICSCA